MLLEELTKTEEISEKAVEEAENIKDLEYYS